MEKCVKTILISPHCDDIAFSIGGLMALNYFEVPLKIVTVFSKSIYFPCSNGNNCEFVSVVRNTEENIYAKTVGAELSFLHFPDSSLRENKESKHNAFKEFYKDDPIFVNVFNSLSNIMSEYPEADIVCPLGIGNHVDHLFIFNICTKLCIDKNRKIIFYEDLPYAYYIKLRDIQHRVATLSSKYNLEIRPCKVEITNKFSDKINNLSIYKSQICNDKMFLKLKMHSARMKFESENLADFLWHFSTLKYLFKKFNLIQNSRLYERIWIKEDLPKTNFINTSIDFQSCLRDQKFD